MSKTIQVTYSGHVAGALKGNKSFLSRLSNRFPMPANVQVNTVGSATVQLWDDITTATPVAGTLASDGSGNIQVALTLTNTLASIKRDMKEATAMMYDGAAMKEWNIQAGDAFAKEAQGEVIASLIAATPGLSLPLGGGSTGYVNGVIPSAATIPDIINNIIAPFGRLVTRVRSRNGGTNEGMVIVADEIFKARLGALCSSNYAPGYLSMDGKGGLAWEGIPIDELSGVTNFGGASNACAYVIGGKGVAFKWDDPVVYYTTATGWGEPGDGLKEYQVQCPRARGVAIADLVGELTSPAS